MNGMEEWWTMETGINLWRKLVKIIFWYQTNLLGEKASEKGGYVILITWSADGIKIS